MRRLVLLAALVPLLTLTAPADAGPKTYVALGDSYAAGPLIPMQEEPYGCLRSTNNYPKILAKEFGLALTDATCSGAQTKDMQNAQGVTPGPNPPQFDSLSADTDLVTLQIGGNDIGFGGIAETCGRAAFERVSCESKLQGKHAEIDAKRERVVNAILGIQARSPEAEIFVLGYPAIFRIGENASCPAMGVGENDARFLRGIQEHLNRMISEAASIAGAEYVDVYGPSAGRSACDLPIVRWTEPLVPVNAAAPIHPNINGMIGMSDVLELAVKKKLATADDLELPVSVETPSNPY